MRSAGDDHLSRFTASVLLTLVLAVSFLLKLHHLGHPGIKPLDESFHALVAKNLLKHPLTPTLYDKPYLPYDYRDWQSNHIWLHKPIVPLWQMALSMALLGSSTLALRLPSAVLSTAAVWLTYAIGRELLNDRRAALIAAALQAFNPAITSLVHGYVFSDHIDVAFLFWVELAVWFLVRAISTGSLKWIIAAGIAQGIAFQCKTYPAFIVSGIALIAVFLPLVGFADQTARRWRKRELLILLASTILTIAPWTIWCLLKFPHEFLWEQLQVFRHLNKNVENWAAPWDRLIFDFSLRIYHVFYPAVLVAAIVLAPRAWREKNLGLTLLFAWALGVLIPHTLATSKTMTATLIGWPPFLLLLGAMIARAIDGDAWCLGAWFAASVLAAIKPGVIPQQGWGYPNPPRFAVIMWQNIWVLAHVLISLTAALAAALALRRFIRRARLPLIALASLFSLLLLAQIVQIGWRITNNPRGDTPAFFQLAQFVHANLPPNAVLLLEPREKAEHIIAMFQVDRGVYPVIPPAVRQTAQQVRAAGGVTYLLTNRAVPLPAMSDEFLDGLRVYSLGESDLQQSP